MEKKDNLFFSEDICDLEVEKLAITDKSSTNTQLRASQEPSCLTSLTSRYPYGMAQQVNYAPERHTPLQVSSPVKDMEDAQPEHTPGEHTSGGLQIDQPAVEGSEDKDEQALAVRGMLWVW